MGLLVSCADRLLSPEQSGMGMGACGGREQPPWGAGSAATWELVRVGPWPAEGTT